MGQRTEKHERNGQPRRTDVLHPGHHAYLIRIAREDDQERALVAFRGVREAVHSVAEDEFLVSGAHLEALRKAGVSFADITEPSVKHGKAATG